MSNEMWWYLMRAAGLTAWVALTATLVLGAVVSGHMTERRGARRWILDLHPYLAGVGLAALGLHIVAAVADSYVDIGWLDVLVPGTAGWNPVAIALGVLGIWVLAAVEITSLARRHLSRRTWHGIHLLSYAAAWLMALHAAVAGTDLRNPVVAAGGLLLVGAATVVGMRRAWGGREPRTGAVRPNRPATRPAPAAAPRTEDGVRVLVGTGRP
ncbi:MAG: hypothetical protein R2726_15130 [Acidimicrobiales bacterium]